MPHMEGMYAPGNECAHILPPAGFILPFPPDVFRFNRVAPHYPPDPCIRPNEGDLTCPPEYPPDPVNHPWMLAAGTDTRMLSDVFRFNKAYPSTDCNPCKHPQPYWFTSKPQKLLCPCTDIPRYPPSKPGRHFDFRYPAGATECNLATHRRGHVPQDCKMTFPNADEIIYRDTPRPFDCEICPPGRCVCGGQGTFPHNAQGNFSHAQDPLAYSSHTPGNNLQVGSPGYSINNNGYGCMDASMYNNTSAASFHGGPGSFSSKCAPDPYAVTGNLHYKSSGYPTDRCCAQIPVQRADKMIDFSVPCPHCPHPYYPSNYVCRPVYNRRYLLDCPEQDGPPGDTYTFL